jgi:hypothetical protein
MDEFDEIYLRNHEREQAMVDTTNRLESYLDNQLKFEEEQKQQLDYFTDKLLNNHRFT